MNAKRGEHFALPVFDQQLLQRYGVLAARALSSAWICFVAGIPMRTLSIGETCRPVRGTLTVSTGAEVESIFIPVMLEESLVVVVVVMALSPC